jgi:hypothetical protein
MAEGIQNRRRGTFEIDAKCASSRMYANFGNLGFLSHFKFNKTLYEIKIFLELIPSNHFHNAQTLSFTNQGPFFVRISLESASLSLANKTL